MIEITNYYIALKNIKELSTTCIIKSSFDILKNYSVEIFTNALKTVQFPNYNIISHANNAYLDLLNKILDTIDKVVPIKEIRIKNNT